MIPHYPEESIFTMTHLADIHINPLIASTVETTEEAVLNALIGAKTVLGRDGRKVEAIDISRLRRIIAAYRKENP